MTESVRSLMLLLVCMPVIGCATNASQSVPVTDATLAAQEKMFEALQEGQALDETLTLIANFTTVFVEAVDDDIVHHYIAARYPETNVRMGVYFQSRRLVALILEQDVVDLHSCRAGGQSGHWLANGVAPYAEWIEARNMLRKSFDKRMQHYGVGGSDTAGVTDYIEAATYAPIIAIALGAYAADRLMGGHQRDAKRKREREYFERVAPTVQLGVTEDKLLSLMGSYDQKNDVGTMTVITYSQPSYSYGFENDKLVWKESPSTLERPVHFAGSCPISAQ